MIKIVSFFWLIFSAALLSMSQPSATYFFDKDLSDSKESFSDLTFVHHKGEYVTDSIDLLDNVKRYVYRFESLSGLKFVTTNTTNFFNGDFSIEMILKPQQFDENVTIVELIDGKKLSISYPFIHPQKSEKKYVHYVLTRNIAAQTTRVYVNGMLCRQYDESKKEMVQPSEIVFFGQNTKRSSGAVAMIRLTNQYTTADQVKQLVDIDKKELASKEDVTPVNNELLHIDFLNAETGQPMKAHLKVMNGLGELFNSGTYETSFDVNYVKNITYKLIVDPQEKGFMTTIENISIVETPTSKTIKIQPTSVGGKFQLHSIQFKKSEVIMVDGAKEELDYLVALLMDSPSMEILIAGHTDGIGNDELNRELSRKRAMVVEEYLVEQGINRKRLTVEGFGGSQPIATNHIESDRKQNRRVEFTVLKL